MSCGNSGLPFFLLVDILLHFENIVLKSCLVLGIAGQLSISHNTISRKHLTITIEAVKESQVHHATSRPNAIIEDLATKIGTVVNGQRIKGDKYIAESENCVDITMGKCPSSFR